MKCAIHGVLSGVAAALAVWAIVVTVTRGFDFSLPRNRPAQYRFDLATHRFWLSWPRPPGKWAGQINRFGFRYNRITAGDITLSMPAWYLALPAGAVAIAFARSAWRLRKPPAGCCPRCGYDVRATPDRCPECGMVVDPAKPRELDRERPKQRETRRS